jgi:periplasmic protein TonB
MMRMRRINTDKMKNIFVFCFVMLGYISVYAQSNKDDTTIYTCNNIQVQPKFFEDVHKYLSDSIHPYPEDARDSISFGSVYVSFVIEKDGSVSNIKSLFNEGNAPLVRETMKAIKKMPIWIPGMQNGKSVRVQFGIPVNFCIARK